MERRTISLNNGVLPSQRGILIFKDKRAKIGFADALQSFSKTLSRNYCLGRKEKISIFSFSNMADLV